MKAVPDFADAAAKRVGAAFGAILGSLWPRCCESCGEPCDEPLCETCRLAMPLRENALCCARCGKTLIESDEAAGCVQGVCAACRASPPAFDLARSAVSFRGPARALVHALKYHGAPWIAPVMAEFMHAAILASAPDARPDMVVPVPLHRSRMRRRGYDQALALATALAARLRVPCAGRILLRTRRTPTQTHLGADERRANLRNAFSYAPEAASELFGKCVIVVDDVMTTGATFGAAAQALRSGGAEWILCF